MFNYDKHNDIPEAILLALYQKLLYIRLVSEAIREDSLNLKLKCPVHFSLGQEAVSAGVGLNLRKDDCVTITYRSHAPYLAKGGGLKEMIAELYNKKGGCVGGIGGSMHLSSPKNNIFCTAIAGGGVPIAVGMALAFQMQKKDSIAVTFFGDGAADQGVLHESLNFASLKNLPVIFLCENNLYAVEASVEDTKANTEIYKMAITYNIPAVRIDGNNILDVYQETKKAVEKARQDKGPIFVEALTYRWLEHVGPHYERDLHYRTREEVDMWIEKCPLKNYESYLLGKQLLNETLIMEMKNNINQQIQEAWTYMENSPYPTMEEIK